MKKYLLIIAILFSLTGFGQTAPDSYTFTPYTFSRIHSSDSVQVQFQLSTNNMKNATITSIIQTAGPVVKWTTSPSWISGTTTNSAFWLHGLAPGNYAFTATALSGSGTTGTQVATLQVVADPVCPVCPVIPPPRTATAISITINGQVITIPLTGTKITYNDGSTQ